VTYERNNEIPRSSPSIILNLRRYKHQIFARDIFMFYGTCKVVEHNFYVITPFRKIKYNPRDMCNLAVSFPGRCSDECNLAWLKCEILLIEKRDLS